MSHDNIDMTAYKAAKKRLTKKVGIIDPVCLVHGKRMSQHECLYCCLCFRSLTPDECNVTKDGKKEDVCVPCAKKEQAAMRSQRRQKRRQKLRKALNFLGHYSRRK